MSTCRHTNKMTSLQRYTTLLSNISSHLFIYIVISLALPTWDMKMKSAFVEAQLHDDPNMLSYLDADGMERSLTREYTLKQGSLRGLIVEPSRNGELQDVEVFLGIPYAAPPVGTFRFMPPGTAVQWSGVKMATKFAPVCPQMLPDVKKETSPSAGRYNYMKRLLPFLKTQSEDCLYLNIYVPSQRSPRGKPIKYPVLVFIHGESFEWNAGNPYDGTVLASYGKVMVITINYRLGILGFMKLSISENPVGNFGLLDQVAALQWIKQNIEYLNGDPDSVTLMGHSTGAACVNFLMVSPVANGLFHRAILMSGSALSDWAVATHPVQSTLQVVQSLNCPLTNKDMTVCLQKKRLSEIMNVKVLSTKYMTTFGPIIDGTVVPSDPAQLMGVYKDMFSKYQLLYGVTQLESYHLLTAVALQHGMLPEERDAELKEYARARFDYGPDLAFAAALELYTSSQAGRQSLPSASRDATLEVLGDARVSAPLVRVADYHSRANNRSYFYVYAHNSRAGEYSTINKSVYGEELAYVFGAPLGRSRTHFRTQYDVDERLFCEDVMKQWTTFAKTGSPNSPVSLYMNLGPEQWNQYDVEWPEYDSIKQSFKILRIPPYLSSHYRSKHIRFWNNALPEILTNFTKNSMKDYHSSTTTTQKIINHQGNQLSKDRPQWSSPKIVTQSHHPISIGPANEVYGRLNTHSAPSKQKQDDSYRQIKAIESPAYHFPSEIFEKPQRKMDKSKKEIVQSTKDNDDKEAIPIKSSAATINVILAIGVIFLFVNIVVFAVLFYKKRRLKLREKELKRTNNCIHPDLTNDEENICQKKNKSNSKDSTGCKVLHILHLKTKKATNDKHEHVRDKYFEACKTPKSDDSGGFGQRFMLRRHFSSSTLDAHTKVRDWITNEIVHRCSPMFTRKPPAAPTMKLDQSGRNTESEFTRNKVKKEHKSEEQLNVPKPNCQIGSLTGSLHGGTNSTASLGTVKIKKSNTILSEKTNSTSAHGSNRSIKSKEHKKGSKELIKETTHYNKKSKKGSEVSGINDGTGVQCCLGLSQKPAALSKSFDYCYEEDDGNEIEKPLRRSQTMAEFTQQSQESNHDEFISAIKLQVNEKLPETENPVYTHKHSVSDPVKNLIYDDIVLHIPCVPTKDVKSDIQPPVAFRNDINVTSKDESIVEIPLTAAESIAIIKKRNFPKVLPDFPHKPVALVSMVQKRLSLPPQNNIMIIPSDNYLLQTGSLRPGKNMTKNAPVPPPRTTSTLDRRIQHQRSEPVIEESHSDMIFKKGHFRGSSFGSTHVPSPTNRVNLLKLEEENYMEDKRKLIHDDFGNFHNRPKPTVIISGNEQIIGEPKFIIKSKSGCSSPSVSMAGARVKLDTEEDLSSLGHGSLVSASSFNLNSDSELDQSEEELDNIADASLLRELIGASDTSIDIHDMLPDTKGPATIFEKKHEIVKIKTNPSIPSPKIYDSISFAMPGAGLIEDFEKTAQIKQKFSLHKFQNRSDTINSPIEKAHKVNEKSSKIPKTPIFTAKLKKDKTEHKSPTLKLLKGKPSGRSTGLQRQPNFETKENSTSDSSNDTESSTGTVKKVS